MIVLVPLKVKVMVLGQVYFFVAKLRYNQSISTYNMVAVFVKFCLSAYR